MQTEWWKDIGQTTFIEFIKPLIVDVRRWPDGPS